MNATTNRFSRHSKKVLVVIIVLMTLVLDVLMTGAYHLFKYGTIHKFAHRNALREPSHLFHHTLKANGRHPVEKWGNRSYVLATNSLGLKDRRPREVSATTPKARILFLGDSFTEGVGYPYEQTFVGLVDAAMEEQDVEILNGAVASYSPAIYWKKAEYLIESMKMEIHHVAVFLDLSDIHDESRNYAVDGGRVVWIGGRNAALRDWIFEYTGLLKNVWVLGENLQRQLQPTPGSVRSDEETVYGLNHFRSLWTINNESYEDYGKDGIKKAAEHLDQLYRLLARHHIQMSLAVYPWPDQIYHQQLDSLQVTYWEDWARSHSVAFFNFFPDFISLSQEPKKIIETFFIRGDVHWNEAGHELMAKRFLEKFQKAYPDFPLHNQLNVQAVQ